MLAEKNDEEKEKSFSGTRKIPLTKANMCVDSLVSIGFAGGD